MGFIGSALKYTAFIAVLGLLNMLGYLLCVRLYPHDPARPYMLVAFGTGFLAILFRPLAIDEGAEEK